MKKIIDILISNKTLLFFTFLIGIVFTFYCVSFPKFTGKLNGFNLENNEHFQHYFKMDSIFGNSKKIYLQTIPDGDNRSITFQAVKEITHDISKKYPKAHCISPATFYSKMIRNWKKRDNSLASFFSEAKTVPFLKQLISKDQSSFIILITFPKKYKIDVHEFDTIIQKKRKGIHSIHAMSSIHLEKSIEEHVGNDIVKISLSIIGMFFLFNFLIFRKINTIFYTSLIVCLSLICSMIVFQLFHYQMNLISILVIPIVLILSLSDAQHLLSGYIKQNHIENKNERLKQVCSQYILPSFFSSLTTSCAFFSFYLFNESIYIREFGLVTSISLILEFLVVFSVAPFLLYIFNFEKLFDKNILGLSTFLNRFRKQFSYGLLFILFASIFVAGKLKFYTDSELFFPDHSEIKATHEKLKKNYYSSATLRIFIRDTPEVFKNGMKGQKPLFDVTKDLVKRIEQDPSVVSVNSATDTYFFKSKLGIPINLYSVLNETNPYYDSKSNTYMVEVRFSKSSDIIAFQQKNMGPLLKGIPPGRKVSYSSPAILTNEINKSVSKSLINSLATSGIVIFLFILLLTRSFKISFLSLIPNVVPVAFVIIIYYLSGMTINILTAITAVICLGLLDDDTIHILYRRLWLKEPMEELSFSILSSAILLIVGFGLFFSSSFEPIRVLGWVSALIFLIGAICEMTMMQWVFDQVKNKGNK